MTNKLPNVVKLDDLESLVNTVEEVYDLHSKINKKPKKSDPDTLTPRPTNSDFKIPVTIVKAKIYIVTVDVDTLVSLARRLAEASFDVNIQSGLRQFFAVPHYAGDALQVDASVKGYLSEFRD